ncbi:MAG: outer membrane beta-barrel protein, partial [Bacteroidaceae bacterium]|nr:outer membrane beta-barrel protein [Bacteroidaceae bacterium]
NPNLQATLQPSLSLSGGFKNKNSFHSITWDYRRIYNAVAMGYIYDTQTGVRTYRPENVDGNWSTMGKYIFNHSFGEAKKMHLEIPLTATYNQNVDLMGVDGVAGSNLSRVYGQSLSVAPCFKADWGKQHFEITCRPTWERLTGERADFVDFDALTMRTTLSATLKLPWKIDLNTDFSLYTRSGYADARLNSADWVWNGRLTRPFFKGSLLVMLDGFDILGQLSNVTRTINAQGRTETFTSVMPSYALMHVVYRFNKEPKKR